MPDTRGIMPLATRRPADRRRQLPPVSSLGAVKKKKNGGLLQDAPAPALPRRSSLRRHGSAIPDAREEVILEREAAPCVGRRRQDQPGNRYDSGRQRTNRELPFAERLPETRRPQSRGRSPPPDLRLAAASPRRQATARSALSGRRNARNRRIRANAKGKAPSTRWPHARTAPGRPGSQTWPSAQTEAASRRPAREPRYPRRRTAACRRRQQDTQGHLVQPNAPARRPVRAARRGSPARTGQRPHTPPRIPHRRPGRTSKGKTRHILAPPRADIARIGRAPPGRAGA